MPAVTHERKDDLAALASLCQEIRRELLRARRSLDAEIHSYPTPIPRCDAQFNHLHEQRARLARELDRIGGVDAKPLHRDEYLGLIEEFIASTPYTDDLAEREFRSNLGVRLSAIGE